MKLELHFICSIFCFGLLTSPYQVSALSNVHNDTSTTGNILTHFTLVDSDNDSDIFNLESGMAIDFSMLQGKNINIRANTVDTDMPYRVRFTLSGAVEKTMTEQQIPYALFGDLEGDYQNGSLSPGTYSLRAEVRRQDSSLLLDVLEIHFTVLPDPEITEVTIITDGDTVSNTYITDSLVNDAYFDRGHDNTNSDVPFTFASSIVAMTNIEESGSVAFDLSGPIKRTHIENVAPFALFGDIDGRFNFSRGVFPEGFYTLHITPYSRANAQGDQGDTHTITFTIVDFSLRMQPNALIVDAETDQTTTTLGTDGTLILTPQNSRLDHLNLQVIPEIGTPNSVTMQLEGPVNNNQTERTSPYALFGDNEGDFFPATLTPGNYTLTATPNTAGRSSFRRAFPLTIDFSVSLEGDSDDENDNLTFVPDESFERALIEMNLDDVRDGFVRTAAIDTVTELDLSFRQIRDLVGLQDFKALEVLNVRFNFLTSLDVTQNTELRYLNTYVQQGDGGRLNTITSGLDLSQNAKLVHLEIGLDGINELDLSNNLELIELNLIESGVGSLDLSKHTNLKRIVLDHVSPSINLQNGSNENIEYLGYFDSESNIPFSCIQVDDIDFALNNPNWDIAFPEVISTDCFDSGSIIIPDNNFEQALIDLNLDDVLDNEVNIDNVNQLTILDLRNKGIQNLEGIEAFTSLVNLDISDNPIIRLDLSANHALTSLTCLDMLQLESMNLKNGNNTALVFFNATGSIELSCIQVDDITFALNNTSWLVNDRSVFNENCIDERKTFVPNDIFEQLLISLGYDDVLDNSVRTANIETITELTVSGASISDLTGIQDFIALENLDCSSNRLRNLNLSALNNLRILNCRGNELTSINLSANTNLTHLNISNQLDRGQGSSLRQINLSTLIALTHLNTGGNFFFDEGELDLSHNTALKEFRMSGDLTGFNQLDLSHNIQLEFLELSRDNFNTQQAKLDLSSNTALKTVRLDGIESVNLQNGNNGAILEFSAPGGVLRCVQVDDVEFARNNPNWNVNTLFVYSLDCSMDPRTFIPDDNFEQALIDLGLDDILDDSVLTTNIENIESLDISATTIGNEDLRNLEGLQDFVSLKSLNLSDHRFIRSLPVSTLSRLEFLDCSNNRIRELDLSGLTQLEFLDCSRNAITRLNVSNNSALTHLECQRQNGFGGNSISTLDISNSVNLEFLNCSNNNLLFIDLTRNIELQELIINNTSIDELDVSQNTKLIGIDVNLNSLIFSLDFSNNPELIGLSVNGNALLERINLNNGNNENLNFLLASGPLLNCIQVDDLDFAINNTEWSAPVDTYSLDCFTGTSSTSSTNEIQFSMYPNPTTNMVHMAVSENAENIKNPPVAHNTTVLDMTGRVVQQYSFKASESMNIDVSTLRKGVYLIQIQSINGISTKKLVVE